MLPVPLPARFLHRGEGEGSRTKTAGGSSRRGDEGTEERGDESCVFPLVVRDILEGEGICADNGGDDRGDDIWDRVLLIRDMSYGDLACERGGVDGGEAVGICRCAAFDDKEGDRAPKDGGGEDSGEEAGGSSTVT